MNILVTGAGGQLGQELHRVVDEQSSKHSYYFCDRGELDLTDASTLEAFLEAHTIDLIINAAAYTAVDRAEDELAQADLVNHQAVATLARLAKLRNAFLIHISTDYVFSGEAHTPYTEEAPTAPLGVYGQTKRLGEEAILASGVRHQIYRTSWLYSAYGSNFVKTMCRLQQERSELNVVFDQIGSPTWARDLAHFLYIVVEQERLEVQGIFHYSNEGVCSWYDLAEAVRRLTKADCRIRPIRTSEYPTRAKRPAYAVLDKTKLKETLGIELPHWQTSLASCITEIQSLTK